MRILALDVGDKRIGVAVSDLLSILASPLIAIERTSDSQGHRHNTAKSLDEQEAGEIVVGLPISLSGGYSGSDKVCGRVRTEAGGPFSGSCEHG